MMITRWNAPGGVAFPIAVPLIGRRDGGDQEERNGAAATAMTEHPAAAAPSTVQR
jgi:hypothetical protein